MNIFICATAIRSSGTLTILKQFLGVLPRFVGNDQYYIFISNEVSFPEIKNVMFIPVSTQKWLKRIRWDEKGFKSWIYKNGIKPDLIVSFQNTGLNYKGVPQLIYYHQPLPLMEKKWSFFRKEERFYFMIKTFYAFFVNRYISGSTQFVVQIPSIKVAFIRKFKINPTKVHIMRPDLVKIDHNKIKKVELGSDLIHFIYPASPLIYKNHADIVSAIYNLKLLNSEYLSKIRVHISFTPDDNKKLFEDIRKKGLLDNFIFDGMLSFEKLLSLYKSVDALLFPSYIETFGLPLLEAAGFGLPVIASDVPFAKDVIGGYEGASFIKLHDVDAWSDAITAVCKERPKYTPMRQSDESDWDAFFALMYDMMQKKS